MKNILFHVLLLVFSNVSTSQDVVWQHAYGTTGMEKAWAAERLNNGGYMLLGTSNGQTYIAQIKENGDTTWTKSMDLGIGYGFKSLSNASKNEFLISGRKRLYRIDEDGHIVWEKNYDAYTDLNTFGNAKETTDGKYITVANMAAGIGELWRLDENGEILWVEDSVSFDMGLIVEAGTYTFVDAFPVFSIKKYENADNVLFQKSYELLNISIQKLIKTTDEGYMILAEQSGNTLLIKTDSNGDTLWTSLIDENVSVYPRSLFESSEGEFYITGSVAQLDRDIYILKADQNGQKLWSSAFSRFGSDEDIVGGFFECDSSLLVYGDGENGPIGSDDLLLIKFKMESAPHCLDVPCLFYPNQDFVVHPNPVADIVGISTNGIFSGSIAIFDSQGRKVVEQTASEQSCVNLKVSKLLSGIYIIKIQNTLKANSFTLKFLKL